MQFTYTRKEKIQKPAVNGVEQPEEFKDFTDTLNTDLVIRSVEREDGSRLVLLNDLHRRKERVPILDKKGKMTGTKMEENTFQSEIILNPSDSSRFLQQL
jgi:hypothetical protein